MMEKQWKKRKKKENMLWILALLLGMLFCTGCGASGAAGKDPVDHLGTEGYPSEVTGQQEEIRSEWEAIPEEEEMMHASDTLEAYLEELNLLESSVREYGEGNSFQVMDEDFVARIFYPEGEIRSLSDAVDQWVMDTIDHYQKEAVGSAEDGDTAELTVDYNSYLIEGEWISIKLSGIFDKPYLAHPVDVSVTFNASQSGGQLLELNDVLKEGGMEILRDKVAADAGIEKEDADDRFLDHWLLTHDGVEITLVRGDYLPMSEGTKVFSYSYSELKDILAEGFPGSGDVKERAEEEPKSGSTESEEETPENSGETEKEPGASTEAALPGDSVNTEADGNSEASEGPMLALTFDDGPSAHTGRLLDIFAAHGGKGTFFIVGNMIDTYPDLVKRTAAEGHELGGHSWNHRQLTKLGSEELKDQMMTTRAKIFDVTGKDTMILRPPYGSSNKEVEAMAGSLGIALVNWSVDTLDWKNKNPDAIKKVILDQAADGAIILCHDLHKTTVDAMESVIPELIAKGYRLVTVSELLSSQGGTVTAGKMYYKR